jgi:hypothetical protein
MEKILVKMEKNIGIKLSGRVVRVRGGGVKKTGGRVRRKKWRGQGRAWQKLLSLEILDLR